MPYSQIKYPASFALLKPEIRKKAISIANILIEEGLDRFTAETIAFYNSREIAMNANSLTNAHITDSTIHIIPHPDGWVIISPDARKFYGSFVSKKEAITKARSYAKSVKFKLFIHLSNGNIGDCESFIVNRPSNLAPDRLPYSKYILSEV